MILNQYRAQMFALFCVIASSICFTFKYWPSSLPEISTVQKIGNVNGPGVNVEIFELARKDYKCVFAVQNQVTMFQCVR